MSTGLKHGCMKIAAALALLTGIGTSAAVAGDGVFDEVKLGVQAHDVGIGGHHKENGYDINGELLFVSPDFLKWAYAPRPHIGVSGNTDGNTDQVYAGLTWTVYGKQGIFSSDNNFFVNLGLGGSLNDGAIFKTDGSRKDLGSHVLFREGLDVGYWIMEKTNVSLYLDHISDAGLTTHNDGLTNLGVRVGFGL
jgi:lipid A 3-O-deacylase